LKNCGWSFIKTNLQAVAVSSGTAALHLAYLACGVKRGDEVICPVFTCTATNLPLLYIGAKPVFADIQKNNLNIDLASVKMKITPKTKAIVVVDYGGLPNDYRDLRKICDENNISLIADLAHCIDGSYENQSILEYVDFGIYSFQAIKTVTSGDGGMLMIKDRALVEKIKRLRWFGIDRSQKQLGTWENDVCEVGYKYQMNDISAAIGISNLESFGEIKKIRNLLYDTYTAIFLTHGVQYFEVKNKEKNFTPWLFTINTEGRRVELMEALRSIGIESAQVHYRNDRYTIFKEYLDGPYLNMDALEDSYLVLPLHTQMSPCDARRAALKCIEVLKQP
jgi:dTDP-4-amino-4,6-dideoxygalactose transaminase